VLISSHCCHPSLANDNLSGIAVATFLAQHLAESPRYYSYRFVFVPGTIGSITWLSRNREIVSRIRHGLVATLLGGQGNFTYKKSRRGTTDVDRAVALALRATRRPYEIRPFSPYGYDERQYCSPGFNLPVGCLSRTPFGEFAEYHTSADNLDFVRPEHLNESITLFKQVCFMLETNTRYRNLSPYGEPQLGRRGLYKGVGGGTEGADWQMALLWVLNLSDEEHTLFDIAEQADLPYELLERAAKALLACDLLALVKAH
jgi:aminopeptidase-like protein